MNEQNRERGREREKECVHGSVLVKVWVCAEVCVRSVCGVCAVCVRSVCRACVCVRSEKKREKN